MAWSPSVYERHARDRERPLHDLLARLPDTAPGHIVDLGCGTGNSTAALAKRFPEAALTGVDNAPPMLAKARARALTCDWVEASVEGYDPPAPDLLFSNAALHWVSDHDTLFPRLARSLAEGGTLAVQMPANFEASSHRLVYEIARTGPWASQIDLTADRADVLALADYVRLLLPLFEAVDAWATTYLHRLEGEDAVFSWLSGTTLVPLMAGLEARVRAAFTDTLKARLAEAYPSEPDGTTLFAFRRIFLVASGRRAGA